MTRSELARARLSLALLTDRRTGLFVGMDALFLFAGMMMGVTGAHGSAMDFWHPLIVLPALVVAVPILADAVALERRAGTLDLALTSPGVRFYFERRVGTVAAIAVAQGWLCILAVRAAYESFPLSGPLVQVVTVVLFVAAVTLNWAVRLRTAGAVMFATYVTALAFAPWLVSNPIHPPTVLNGPMTAADIVHWTQNNLVLLAAALTFYLYARQRLARPELMIT